MPRVALYAGSFDPVTNGHLDVVRQAVRLADRLVLAVGVHPGKAPMFTADERLAMLEETCRPLVREAGMRTCCITFADLVVTAARRAGAGMLIRGLRDGTDLDYEMQMAGMNGTMAPDVTTVFFRPRRWSARSPPHWSGRSRPWAAMSPPSYRPACRSGCARKPPASPAPDRIRNSRESHDNPPYDRRPRGLPSFAVAFAAPASAQSAALSNPAALTEKAPATYKVRFDTSKGAVVIEVNRDWAPNGADRFYNLVKNGFYDDARFFRVIPRFMVQFGIHGDPALSPAWRVATITDDPVKQSNKRGFVHVCDVGPELPHHAGVHQFRRQYRPRQPGLRAVRPDRLGDGRGRPAFRRLRRRRAIGPRSRPDPRAARRQCLSDEGLSEDGLHQEGDPSRSNGSGRSFVMATGFHCMLPAVLGVGAIAMAGPAVAQCSVLDSRPCAPSFCSVFDPEPCIPDLPFPFGEGLRLTIQAKSDGAQAEPPNGKLNTIQDVFAALRACYVPPPAGESKQGTQMTVVFSFKRDGEIFGEPRFTFATPGISTDVKAAYQRAVAAALKRCNRLSFTDKLGGALAGRPFAIQFIDSRDFRRPEKAT